MKRSIVLNKNVSCEHICAIVQDMLQKEDNSGNKILNLEIVTPIENESILLIENNDL
jgi:hypothetical protein